VCDYFQLEDFFTAGLGFDVGGAFLLARGLINRPAELTRLAGSFYGSNDYQALSVARNRLDAVTGITALLAGFGLQAVGYIVTLAANHPIHTGASEALVGAGFAVLALVVAVAAGNYTRRVRLIPLLIEMSHYEMDDTRREFPRAPLLPRWLEALGKKREVGEDDLAFVRRTVNVSDLTVNVNSTAEHPEGRTRRASEPPLEGEVPG
jgi:hypothetical protein